MAGGTRVVFHPEAIAEARAAYSWYGERNQSAAQAFMAELDMAVTRVMESPATWPVYRHETRRCLFERFPFFLVYRQRGEEVEILAVAHAKRRPGYWRSR
jgi:plasmid stabilization system protein ParE